MKKYKLISVKMLICNQSKSVKRDLQQTAWHTLGLSLFYKPDEQAADSQNILNRTDFNSQDRFVMGAAVFQMARL